MQFFRFSEGFSYKKWDEKKGKGYIEVYGGLNLEPVGLVILTILMGILLVQIIGMFIHRLNTVIGAMNEVYNLFFFLPVCFSINIYLRLKIKFCLLLL